MILALIASCIILLTLGAAVYFYFEYQFDGSSITVGQDYCANEIGKFPEFATVTPILVAGGLVLLKNWSGAYYSVGVGYFKRNFTHRLDS